MRTEQMGVTLVRGEVAGGIFDHVPPGSLLAQANFADIEMSPDDGIGLQAAVHFK